MVWLVTHVFVDSFCLVVVGTRTIASKRCRANRHQQRFDSRGRCSARVVLSVSETISASKLDHENIHDKTVAVRRFASFIGKSCKPKYTLERGLADTIVSARTSLGDTAVCRTLKNAQVCAGRTEGGARVCPRARVCVYLCIKPTWASSQSTPSPSPLSPASPPPVALLATSSEKASFCATLVPSPRQPPKRNASPLQQLSLLLLMPSALPHAGTDTIAWLNRGSGGGHDFRPRWSGVTVPSCRRTTASWCGRRNITPSR